MATGNTITTSTGQTYNYDDVVNLILSRYAEGKTPALAVKSALQLGFPEEVIRTLPGVDAAAFEEGKRLIQSGAFQDTATGTMADIQQAAPVGSAQYNARIAAGLDAFGFPPEEVAKLTAQGLYGPGKKYDPGTSGNPVSNAIQQASSFLSSPENLGMAEAAATMQQVTLPDGRILNVYPDGTAQEFTSDGRVKVYNQTGDVILNQTQQEYAQPGYLTPVVNALMAAAGGAVLGPAGAGLLSTPAAAAAGAGGTTLARGGSATDALKAAALAGLTAYGVQGLMGGSAGTETVGAEDLSVYNDIRQLKAAGISDSQIANIIETSYNVTPTFAESAINQVASSTVAPAATETVALESSRLFNPTTLAAPVTAALPSTFVAEPVTVQGQNLPQSPVTVQDLLAVLTPELVSTPPAVTGGDTQSVEVPGTKTTSTENIISSLVPALTTATIPAAAQAVTQPTGTQQVEVTTQRDQPLLPYIVPPVIAAIPALPPVLTAELPKPIQPTQKADEKSLFKPSDILKIIGLLGGAGAGAALSQAGTGTVSTPPSDTLIGSTTPQFGPDYYAAVQRYYNAYMPETPRNVATPLQQWYENKFGA